MRLFKCLLFSAFFISFCVSQAFASPHRNGSIDFEKIQSYGEIHKTSTLNASRSISENVSTRENKPILKQDIQQHSISENIMRLLSKKRAGLRQPKKDDNYQMWEFYAGEGRSRGDDAAWRNRWRWIKGRIYPLSGEKRASDKRYAWALGLFGYYNVSDGRSKVTDEYEAYDYWFGPSFKLEVKKKASSESNKVWQPQVSLTLDIGGIGQQTSLSRNDASNGIYQQALALDAGWRFMGNMIWYTEWKRWFAPWRVESNFDYLIPIKREQVAFWNGEMQFVSEDERYSSLQFLLEAQPMELNSSVSMGMLADIEGERDYVKYTNKLSIGVGARFFHGYKTFFSFIPIGYQWDLRHQDNGWVGPKIMFDLKGIYRFAID
ncbi:hypothetical protein ACQZV8_17185 [Magnetococcales bacterium HHB-1]